MLESSPGQRSVHLQVFAFAHLFVHLGEPPALQATPEGRIFLYCQMVCRNMLHAERQSLFEVTLQHFPAETRNAEDQVDRQIRKTRSLCPPHSLDSLRTGMAPVHQPQLVVVERLHAHAQPVRTRTGQRLQPLFGHIVGIGLDGKLLHTAAIQQRRRPVRQSLQPGGIAERRGPAAEIDGADPTVGEPIDGSVQFAPHRIQHGIDTPHLGAFEKVAIGANPAAKRNMEIKSGHVTNE